MLIVSLLRLLLGIVLLVLLLLILLVVGRLLLLLLRMLLLLLGALRLLLRCGRRYKCEHILVAVLLFLVVVHNMHIIGNLDPASKLHCLPLTMPIALNVVLSMTGRRWTARVEVNHLSLLRVHVLAVCCVLLPTVVLVLLVILVVIVGLGLGKGSLVGRAGAGA